MKPINVSCIQFSFVKDFVCDGRFCNSQCCSGWRVEVDGQHRHKLLDIKNKELRKEITDNLQYNDEIKMHTICMLEDGTCPFVGDDYLCRIQKNEGEDKLPDICVTFPRWYYKFSEYIYADLSIACPLVAKIALLNGEPLFLEEVDVSIKRPRMIKIMTDECKFNSNALDILCASMAILQKKDFSLKNRLILLGIFYDTVEKNYSSGNIDEIIRDFTNTNVQVNLLNGLSNVQLTPLRFTRDICKILEDIFANPVFYSREKEHLYINMFKKCFDINVNSNIGAFIERYNRLSLEYDVFVKRYPYLEENFLIYGVFPHIIQIFYSHRTLVQNYAVYLIYYRIFKLGLLTLVGCKGEELTDKDIVAYISTFAKRVRHGSVYFDVVDKYVESNHDDVLEIMRIWLA